MDLTIRQYGIDSGFESVNNIAYISCPIGKWLQVRGSYNYIHLFGNSNFPDEDLSYLRLFLQWEPGKIPGALITISAHDIFNQNKFMSREASFYYLQHTNAAAPGRYFMISLKLELLGQN
jgi:hypothetical protein